MTIINRYPPYHCHCHLDAGIVCTTYRKKALKVLADGGRRRPRGRRRRRRHPLPLAARLAPVSGDGVVQVGTGRLRRRRRLHTCCSQHEKPEAGSRLLQFSSLVTHLYCALAS